MDKPVYLISLKTEVNCGYNYCVCVYGSHLVLQVSDSSGPQTVQFACTQEQLQVRLTLLNWFDDQIAGYGQQVKRCFQVTRKV